MINVLFFPVVAILGFIAVVLIVVILALSLLARPRNRREGGRERLEFSFNVPLGGGVGVSREEAEVSRNRPARTSSSVVREEIIRYLSEMQSLPLEDIFTNLPTASRDVVIDALRSLEREGLVRIEGGLIMLSEKGEKFLAYLREKYLREEFRKARRRR